MLHIYLYFKKIGEETKGAGTHWPDYNSNSIYSYVNSITSLCYLHIVSAMG